VSEQSDEECPNELMSTYINSCPLQLQCIGTVYSFRMHPVDYAGLELTALGPCLSGNLTTECIKYLGAVSDTKLGHLFSIRAHHGDTDLAGERQDIYSVQPFIHVLPTLPCPHRLCMFLGRRLYRPSIRRQSRCSMPARARTPALGR
jgi:hypothetical protein